MTREKDMQADEHTKGMSSNDMIAQIVSAFAQRPDVAVSDIVNLTRELYAAFSALPAVEPAPRSVDEKKPTRLSPVIPIEDAVSQDKVTCLCCGKSFKTLKRHLMAAHGMTEDDYREAFDLPNDFPLVAPDYSERRSQVASESGFGTYDRSQRSGSTTA